MYEVPMGESGRFTVVGLTRFTPIKKSVTSAVYGDVVVIVTGIIGDPGGP
jgi:hypothetical protein